MSKKSNRESNVKINDLARFLTQYLWGEELDIPVTVNNRFRTTLGMCVVNKYIQISKDAMANEDAMIDTLLHELCHWYCYSVGLYFSDDDEDFIKEIENVGSTLSGYTTFIDGEYFCYTDDEIQMPYIPNEKVVAIKEAYKTYTQWQLTN